MSRLPVITLGLKSAFVKFEWKMKLRPVGQSSWVGLIAISQKCELKAKVSWMFASNDEFQDVCQCVLDTCRSNWSCYGVWSAGCASPFCMCEIVDVESSLAFTWTRGYHESNRALPCFVCSIWFAFCVTQWRTEGRRCRRGGVRRRDHPSCTIGALRGRCPCRCARCKWIFSGIHFWIS